MPAKSKQARVVFPLDVSALLAQQRDADRFVYSNYFQPLALPATAGQVDPAAHKSRRATAYVTTFDGRAGRVVYCEKDGRIYELCARPDRPLALTDLTANAQAPRAAGPPLGWNTDLNGPVARVMYRGEDRQIHELSSRPGVPWTHANLSAIDGAPDAAGDPTGYVTPDRGPVTRVLYRGTDAHVHELSVRSDMPWSHIDITSAAQAPLAAGDPAGRYTAANNGTQCIVYRGVDGHVHQVTSSQGQLAHADLTAATAAAPPAAGDPAEVRTAFNGVERRVVYRGIDGHVHELSSASGVRWAYRDLTATANAPSAAGDPTTFVSQFGGPRLGVVFCGIDGHVHELSHTPNGSWSHADLTDIADAPVAAADPTSFATEDAPPHVIFRGDDGRIHQLALMPGATWSHTRLSPERPGEEEVQQFKERLRSDIGYLWLDRTRITPAGFALGEHLYSMSLAPGEEVVIEQKTFSKRETTFEEQNEQEEQFDLELSSSLSTELTQGFERENTRNEQTTRQIGGSMGAGMEGIPIAKGLTGHWNINVDASYAKTVDEGSRVTATRSVKDSSTSSRKVAAKYRAVHKTTFKISTETRFETSSKRVVRNPNQFSTLDVTYFKILQRLALRQERYGVRLCWAPPIKAPAQALYDRIAREAQEIRDRILNAVVLPTRPQEPEIGQPPPPRIDRSPELTVPDSVWERGWYNDLSDEIDVSIAIPPNFVWDGNADFVRRRTRVWATNVDRNWGWWIVGEPWVADGYLWVRIHVGCDYKLWGARGDIHMQAVGRFIGDPAVHTQQYKVAYDQWQVNLKGWEAEVEAKLREPRQQAEAEAAKREQDLLAALDPVAELVDRVVQVFPTLDTDEPWEIEAWTQIFDWDRAGWVLYPAPWGRDGRRDWTRPSTDFVNASWAKLYVPVRPGLERLALRWMVGKVLATPLGTELEQTFERIETELADFRRRAFGDAVESGVAKDGTLNERVLTLASWEELLPTDGTHAEVVQGMSSAIDDRDAAELSDVRALRALVRSSEQKDVELKKRALDRIGDTTPVNVSVAIATEESHGNNAAGQ